MNYAHLDVLSVLMAGMGLDPTPVIERFNTDSMSEYRENHTLEDSVYWLSDNYHKQGIPFDAIAEQVLNIPKSTFYRRSKEYKSTVDGVSVGLEYEDALKFLASGLKHGKGSYQRPDRRLDEFVDLGFEKPELKEEYMVDPVEPEVEEVSGDEKGFTF